MGLVPAHAHGHGHAGHDHSDALRRTAARNVGRLWVALALTVVFVVVEAITAFVAGSLALLSDAAHMLTDGVAIALALGSIVVANRASKEGTRTFGLFRLEILASLVNAILTFAVAGYVLFEAVVRLTDGDGSVEAGPMLVVAIAGLAVNLIVFFMLRTGAQDSLAVRGAYVDAMADAAGSVGVIVAAIVIATTGWDPIDPIVAAIIGVWILPRAWRLAASALRVLLQVAPAHLALDAIRDELMALPGVVDVHDLHVWTLTSEMDVASAHVMVGPDADAHGVLTRRACSCSSTRSRTPPSRWSPTTTRDAPSSTGEAQPVTVVAGRGRRGRAGGRVGDAGRSRHAAATASPAPSPSVSITRRRANPAEKVLGTCELPRLVTSARPPATNRKMVATSTSGTADSAPLRQIHPRPSSPRAMPANEYALSPNLVPNEAVDASHSPITCTISVTVSNA